MWSFFFYILFILFLMLENIRNYVGFLAKIYYTSFMEQNIVKQLIEKSKEAFLLGIEIFNKPTIKYRVEGFAYFICNAWELLLKAHLINKKGIESIYYKDNPERTITLEVSIRKVFTNENDPLRKNLETIVDLRNTSTHFVVIEYETVYAPLFQACINNYLEKLNDFHGENISSAVPFTTVQLFTTCPPYSEMRVRDLYAKPIADKLVNAYNLIDSTASEVSGNMKYAALTIIHNVALTKDSKIAAERVRISKNPEDQPIVIQKINAESGLLFPHSSRKVVELVKKRLAQNNIEIKFTTSTFQDFIKHLDLKNDKNKCYKHQITKQATFSYNDEAVNTIVNMIIGDIEICERLRRLNYKKNSQPQEQGISQ